MTSRALALLAPLVAMLAACGDDAQDGPRSTAARGKIDFRASASLAQPAQRLTLAPDGAAVLVSGREPERRLRVPPAAVAQLHRLLAAAGFDDMQAYYGPRAMTDVPTYSIAAGSRRVRTESGSPPAPPKLWAIVRQLEEVVDEAKRPFLVRVTLIEERFLRLTVRPDGSATVETASGARDVKLGARHLRAIRRTAAGLDERALEPGLVARTNRNPPPTVEITRAYSSFHAPLDRASLPPSAAALVDAARSAALSAS